MDEEISVTLPPSFEKENMLYRLKKSMYGLKQMPRNWYRKLCKILKTIGFIELESASCVFRIESGNAIVIIMIYFDDLMITSESEGIIADTKNDLGQEFEITDLGLVNHFLGSKFKKGSSDLYMKLSQTAYVEKILDRFRR